MENPPGKNSHPNTNADKQDSPESLPSDGIGRLIVDEHGHAYKQKWNPYRKAHQNIKALLSRIPHGERMSLALTLVIAFSAIAQTVQSGCNNASTTKQVDRLIDSANRISDAADSFSLSAAHINSGVDEAVSKLDAQAKATRDSVTQSKANFTKDQRPYLMEDDGPDSALFGGRLDVGAQGGLAATFWIKNYGKSPAIRTKTQTYLSAVSATVRDVENDIRFPPFEKGDGGTYGTGSRFSKTATGEPGSYYTFTNMRGPNAPETTAYAVHTLVEYYDIAGNRYTTEICTLGTFGLGSKRCKTHNHIE